MDKFQIIYSKERVYGRKTLSLKDFILDHRKWRTLPSDILKHVKEGKHRGRSTLQLSCNDDDDVINMFVEEKSFSRTCDNTMPSWRLQPKKGSSCLPESFSPLQEYI